MTTDTVQSVVEVGGEPLARLLERVEGQMVELASGYGEVLARHASQMIAAVSVGNAITGHKCGPKASTDSDRISRIPQNTRTATTPAANACTTLRVSVEA